MLALVNPFTDAFPGAPENLANLLWVIVALPLLGAFLCGVLGKFMGRANTNFVACFTVFGSFILSCLTLWAVGAQSTQFVSPASGMPVRWSLWLDLGRWFSAGDFSAHYGFLVDRLTAAVLMVITGIGFLIHVYSTEYMEHDDGYWRYFAYLNLFVAMMLTLVMADNLVLLFVGWEGVGLCSYLLIGFWYQDTEKAFAGRKAMITNRIGDFGFLIGMFLLVLLLGATEQMGRETTLGRSSFSDIGRARAWVTSLHDQGPLNIEVLREWAIRMPSESTNRPGMNLGTTITTEGPLKGKTFGHVLTAALLLLLLGAAGKSAQIPLYVWLPDAMAGPTPVSALIHAATMVTAGVYLFCRLSFLLVLSPTAMAWVAMIGTITAIWAALIAFAQNDIKKVLAYSTVSQLGFMFMGVGVGVFWAAALHLVTHACFKACLFLGAGSVMHGNSDETDVTRLGGLRKEMPWTWATFAIATLAITGIVPLSGFFSKDAILHGAHTTELTGYPWVGHTVYWLGLFGALCTAFYMTRLYVLTFEGKRAADARTPHAHESGFRMVFVLVVLAFLSVAGVVWGLPDLVPGPGGRKVALMEGYLAPAMNLADRFASINDTVKHVESPPWLGYAIAWAVALIGGAAGWLVYRWWLPARAGKPLPSPIALFWRWARAKFYVDELYDYLLIRPFTVLSKGLYKIVDAGLIDGVGVGGTALVLRRLGGWLRYTQTGNAQNYATVMAVGLLVSIGVVLTWVLR